MTSPLIGGHVQPKSTPTQVQIFKSKSSSPNLQAQTFKSEAYSDDGYCRKLSGSRPKPSSSKHASRAPIV
jgi:hypothetical protein